ncbi:hypothetical protein OPT61_g7191 [Boeremia exigua]|uniref:Uncharacterized protein n=1 Tax=Boeremia exigua TaxID=749465 RepID=A0ACC2I4H7_9PLEO|nr:hypothetical protein OPT61_g7191 [Boeremia exigua]
MKIVKLETEKPQIPSPALKISLNHPCNPTPKIYLNIPQRHPTRSKLPAPSTQPTSEHAHTAAAHTSRAKMKLLTLNFLTCAIKTCKTQASSFPLHPADAELEIQESDVNLPFLKNILPRLMWEEIRTICKELGLPELPPTPPSPADLIEGGEASAATTEGAPVEEQPSQTARDLHRVLLETCIQEGKLVCGCCGHEYAVKEGVANFLLPGHLV